MVSRFKHQTQKAVTARFSISDYYDIEKEAESLGTTVADVLRISWTEYNKKIEIQTALSELEINIMKNIFNIFCAVQGLSEQERHEASLEIYNILGVIYE
ncbi:hypothetical protein [Vibrio diazotrophicus]|uniref:hypothetical protein n=1 Tax=Vibrio diazotrophicus TaxID=685 RepID=UPI000C9EA573|nr:hypothetical protein [Vibrio diazotrophicus]PNH80068.1 hypothetical protein C1N27_11035 [Vibrio diazotrophicus]